MTPYQLSTSPLIQRGFLVSYESNRQTPLMAVYLNTYETWQAYGGPEEGNWWFECGEPVQSVFYSDEALEDFLERTTWEERCELLTKATNAYTQGKPPTPKDTGYGGYTFMPGSDEPTGYHEDNSFNSCFEDHFAKFYPEERPYYC